MILVIVLTYTKAKSSFDGSNTGFAREINESDLGRWFQVKLVSPVVIAV